MSEASELFRNLPKGLRTELIDCYQSIMSNYVERRWRSTELDGGRFCEIVYTIVDGALSDQFADRASKPKNLFQSCIDLEKKYSPSATRVGDRSLRILIPRLLPVLYEIRNNRNVGHVGGDVNPDHMDAEAVQSMASWLMAELVRIFHGMSTARAEEVIDALVERKLPLIWDVGGVKRVLDHKKSAKDQSLLLLYQCESWLDVAQLISWIEYSNSGVFRTKVLKPMHDQRLIEFDAHNKRVRISPKGAKDVEDRLLQT